MSSSAYIVLEVEEEVYVPMYINYDGYPTYTGELLKKFYTDFTVVTRLIACAQGGGFSQLPTPNMFLEELEAVRNGTEETLVYTDIKPDSTIMGYNGMETLETVMRESGVSYIYLFDCSQEAWQMTRNIASEWKWNWIEQINTSTGTPLEAVEKSAEFVGDTAKTSDAITEYLLAKGWNFYPNFKVVKIKQ